MRSGRALVLLGLALVLVTGPSAVAPSESDRTKRLSVVHERDGLGSFFAKLEGKGDVRIAYLGGSVTQIAGYRPRVTAWLERSFPTAEIDEINAGVGGTGSVVGVYRLARAVLPAHPDLVFVEFAVNDAAIDHELIRRAMEGIVRQIWSANPEAEICFLYAFRSGYERLLRQGKNPNGASAAEEVAEHYGIPSINLALRVQQAIDAGDLVARPGERSLAPPRAGEPALFSADGIHPLVAGHELYAGVIIEALDRMRAPKRRSHAAQLDTKLTEAPLEKVSYVPVAKDMLQGSWSPLVKASPATRADPGVERVWTTTQAGDELRFRFRGRSVALYEVLGGGGAAAYHDVDGSSIVSEARCLRAGERPHLRRVPIAEGLDADRVHEVVIKLAADPCRLSGARRPKPGDTPALRVAALLLEGELVEEGPGSTPSSTREVRQEKGGGA